MLWVWIICGLKWGQLCNCKMWLRDVCYQNFKVLYVKKYLFFPFSWAVSRAKIFKTMNRRIICSSLQSSTPNRSKYIKHSRMSWLSISEQRHADIYQNRNAPWFMFVLRIFLKMLFKPRRSFCRIFLPYQNGSIVVYTYIQSGFLITLIIDFYYSGWIFQLEMTKSCSVRYCYALCHVFS